MNRIVRVFLLSSLLVVAIPQLPATAQTKPVLIEYNDYLISRGNRFYLSDSDKQQFKGCAEISIALARSLDYRESIALASSLRRCLTKLDSPLKAIGKVEEQLAFLEKVHESILSEHSDTFNRSKAESLALSLTNEVVDSVDYFSTKGTLSPSLLIYYAHEGWIISWVLVISLIGLTATIYDILH